MKKLYVKVQERIHKVNSYIDNIPFMKPVCISSRLIMSASSNIKTKITKFVHFYKRQNFVMSSKVFISSNSFVKIIGQTELSQKIYIPHLNKCSKNIREYLALSYNSVLVRINSFFSGNNGIVLEQQLLLPSLEENVYKIGNDSVLESGRFNIYSARYRKVNEMDNTMLSGFDNMLLSEVDYVIL